MSTFAVHNFYRKITHSVIITRKATLKTEKLKNGAKWKRAEISNATDC